MRYTLFNFFRFNSPAPSQTMVAHQFQNQDGDIFIKAALVKKRGGNGLDFEAPLEEDFKDLMKAELLQRYNTIVNLGPIPLSEEEATYVRESERAGKLRLMADKVCISVFF